jgi:hypothetical protein
VAKTDIGVFLVVLAGCWQILGYVLYISQTFKGTSIPNPVSWTLWFFIIILNAASYLDMTGDWVKTLIPIISSIMMVIIYVQLIFKVGLRLGRLDAIEWSVFGLGMAACIVWVLFRSATFGNLLFQLPFAISFIPTIRGVWRNPETEASRAWIMFAAAYFISILVVLLRWQGHLQDLVFPINAFILHGLVASLSFRNHRLSM